jgi:hypothetical protein
MDLLKDVLITRVAASAVAAQTDVAGSILDMAGWDGVLFIAALGDVSATCALELHAEQDELNGAGGMAQVNGKVSYTAAAADADNLLMVLNFVKPLKQFVRAVLKRGTANAIVDGITAIQYRGRKLPATQPATVLGSNSTISPAEGTS